MKKKAKKIAGRRVFPAMNAYAPIPSQITTNDSIVRQNEYLLAICEMSGSMEGNELESLKHATEEDMGTYIYEEFSDL